VTSLSWTQLSPFGASVELDLAGDVPASVVEELVELYEQHRLLLFRSQELTGPRQRQVTGWFGPLLGDGEDDGFISVDPERGSLGAGRLAYHSDLSCTPHPLLGLSLYAVDVTSGATSTLFVDAIGAAASLPVTLRRRVEDRHVENLWPLSLSDRQRRSTVSDDWPGTIQPVLSSHPRSGEPVLYANENHTDRIVELSPDDSEELLQALFSHLYSGVFTYEHSWHRGDFIIWDNRALQHGRHAVPEGVTRTLCRVEVGDHGYVELMPPEVLVAYNAQ